MISMGSSASYNCCFHQTSTEEQPVHILCCVTVMVIGYRGAASNRGFGGVLWVYLTGRGFEAPRIVEFDLEQLEMFSGALGGL